MKFWDSSAVVPLLVEEQARKWLLELLDANHAMLVWWGTPVECVSAVARREREGNMSVPAATEALARLGELSKSWHEVLPSSVVRATAQRLLRVHPLRAADALQLAAAMAASAGDPSAVEFVSLDERLNVAAQRQGFPVVARL